MPRTTVQRLRGFRDFLPRDMALREHITARFEEIFRSHGFQPLDTPALEYAETFEGKSGQEAETLMYRFLDHGNRRVGLRYDLTVPLARVMAMHPDLPTPFKRYHIAPVWRAERPQKGRYREFWQCDVDIVGSDQPIADAEILAIIPECLDAVGFERYRVLINNRKVLAALARVSGADPDQAQHIYRSIDKLAKVGREGVREEMLERGLSPATADRVLEIVSLSGESDEVLGSLLELLAKDAVGSEGVEEMRSILALVPSFGVDPACFVVTPSLARGLDYYTGVVFETVVDEPRVGSVTGGGRYDELVGQFSGRPLPTVGTSLGLERIIDVVEELRLLEPPRVSADALVTTFDDESTPESVRLAARLRAGGISAETYVGRSGNIRRQLAYADRLGIPVALILGPDERARGEVAIRDMRSGEQTSVPCEQAPERVLTILETS